MRAVGVRGRRWLDFWVLECVEEGGWSHGGMGHPTVRVLGACAYEEHRTDHLHHVRAHRLAARLEERRAVTTLPGVRQSEEQAGEEPPGKWPHCAAARVERAMSPGEWRAREEMLARSEHEGTPKEGGMV